MSSGSPSQVLNETEAGPAVTRPAAGEDLRVDDYVTPFGYEWHYPSFLWNASEHTLPPDEFVRIQGIPCDAGMPLRIVGLCLPFVYAVDPRRTVHTIDLRRTRIVRLDHEMARTVWRQMKGKGQSGERP